MVFDTVMHDTCCESPLLTRRHSSGLSHLVNQAPQMLRAFASPHVVNRDRSHKWQNHHHELVKVSKKDGAALRDLEKSGGVVSSRKTSRLILARVSPDRHWPADAIRFQANTGSLNKKNG
jgi:hypothetical protein